MLTRRHVPLYEYNREVGDYEQSNMKTLYEFARVAYAR
jgi:hypothetical protein